MEKRNHTQDRGPSVTIKVFLDSVCSTVRGGSLGFGECGRSHEHSGIVPRGSSFFTSLKDFQFSFVDYFFFFHIFIAQ